MGKLNMIGLSFLLGAVGCANGHCRQPQVVTAPQGPTPQADSVKLNSSQEYVWIYKYDGTLQCGEGREKSVDSMNEELKSSGIKARKMEKRSDGMMRAQVCGQGTGRANAFEIPKSQQGSAEAMGFKPWSFN